MPTSSVRTQSQCRHGVRLLSAALVLTLCESTVFSQCGQLIKMHSYAACVPAGWTTEVRTDPDILLVCDTPKPCATFFGAPPRGLTFLFVRPAEGQDGHASYEGPRQLVESVPHAGLPSSPVSEINLGPGPSGDKRQCFMSRRLMSWAGAWEEHYGLKVGSRMFSIWTRYEDKPDRIQEYRAAIMGIISSVTPK